MENIGIVVGVLFIIGMVVIMKSIDLKLRHQREKLPLTAKEEAQYEITRDNLEEVLQWQIEKGMGARSGDHPAYAARKAGEKAPVFPTVMEEMASLENGTL